MTNDRTNTEQLQHETVGKPARATCEVHDWCTVTDPAEHAEFHASATVDLIGPGHEAADGWWAWLVRAVDDQQTSIVLEGQVAGREFDVQVPAVAVAMLLAATDDKAEVRCPTCIHPEGYDRLSGPCPTCHGEGAVPTGRAALDGLLRSLGTDR